MKFSKRIPKKNLWRYFCRRISENLLKNFKITREVLCGMDEEIPGAIMRGIGGSLEGFLFTYLKEPWGSTLPHWDQS